MNKQLEKAYRELYSFLQENPQLIPFQARISRSMDQSDPNDPLGRLKALQFYIQDNKMQLVEEFSMIKVITDKLIKDLQEPVK